MFGLELAASTLKALLDSGGTARLSGEHTGSVLTEKKGCLLCRLLSVGGVESFSQRPRGVVLLLGSSRWTRCFLLADNSPTNGVSCFFSARLNAFAAATWAGWLSTAGISSKKSSDIRDSSSSTSISWSISFLFLLWGSWAFFKTAPGWGADSRTNISAADSCDATDADVCRASMRPEESRTSRLDSETTADESSSKGLRKFGRQWQQLSTLACRTTLDLLHYLTMILKLIDFWFRQTIRIWQPNPRKQWVYLFLLAGWKKLVKVDCFWGEVCAELFGFSADGLPNVFGPMAAAEAAKTSTNWNRKNTSSKKYFLCYKWQKNVNLFFSVEAIRLYNVLPVKTLETHSHAFFFSMQIDNENIAQCEQDISN